ncbi:hypothetical protein [Thermocatellispora tengchongensis]|uniref:hypothetical protein n=1 Tax=Thermocatellispora tengchongensis TaxID=1073253 RepID=UPI0036250850
MDRQLDAYAALAAESPVLLLNRQRRLSPERAAEFRRRAAELMEEFLGDGAPADDEGTWYAGTLLVTPAAAPVPGPPARS